MKGSVHVAMISERSDAAVEECQRRINAQLPRSLHNVVHILSAELQSDESCQGDAVLVNRRTSSWDTRLAVSGGVATRDSGANRALDSDDAPQ